MPRHADHAHVSAGERADEVLGDVIDHDDIGQPEQLTATDRHEARVPGPGADEGDLAARHAEPSDTRVPT